MTRVFVDSDVILDFLLSRAPFAESAAVIFSHGERGKLSLLTSTLSFMNVHYIAGVVTDRSRARSLALRLRSLLELLPVRPKHVDAAFASESRDVEDYVQYDVARDNHVDYLVTRNKDDYPREPSFVMTPAVFLDTLPS
jgi:predicted nucleic acid-binding protein